MELINAQLLSREREETPENIFSLGSWAWLVPVPSPVAGARTAQQPAKSGRAPGQTRTGRAKHPNQIFYTPETEKQRLESSPRCCRFNN